MKKLIYFIVSLSFLALCGCKNDSQGEGSQNSSQGELSDASGVDDVTSEQTRFETEECMTNPIQMAIGVEQTEFDINDVEITLSYGYHFQRDNIYTEWTDESCRFLAGAAILGENFKSLYLEHYPEEERTVFSLFEKLDMGVYDNRLYLLNKLSYEQKNSWDYLYTKTEDGIIYGHSEKVKIPAAMFSGNSGHVLFYVWQSSLWSDEYINENNTGSQNGCAYGFSKNIFIFYEKQGDVIKFVDYFSSGEAEIIW